MGKEFAMTTKTGRRQDRVEPSSLCPLACYLHNVQAWVELVSLMVDWSVCFSGQLFTCWCKQFPVTPALKYKSGKKCFGNIFKRHPLAYTLVSIGQNNAGKKEQVAICN